VIPAASRARHRGHDRCAGSPPAPDPCSGCARPPGHGVESRATWPGWTAPTRVSSSLDPPGHRPDGRAGQRGGHGWHDAARSYPAVLMRGPRSPTSTAQRSSTNGTATATSSTTSTETASRRPACFARAARPTAPRRVHRAARHPSGGHTGHPEFKSRRTGRTRSSASCWGGSRSCRGPRPADRPRCRQLSAMSDAEARLLSPGRNRAFLGLDDLARAGHVREPDGRTSSAISSGTPERWRWWRSTTATRHPRAPIPPSVARSSSRSRRYLRRRRRRGRGDRAARARRRGRARGALVEPARNAVQLARLLRPGDRVFLATAHGPPTDRSGIEEEFMTVEVVDLADVAGLIARAPCETPHHGRAAFAERATP